MILDTTFLIDLLRNEQAAVTLSKTIEQKEILKISTVTVFEIHQGLRESSQNVEALFDDLILLSFDKKTAIKAGEIVRHLRKEGIIIDPEDAMIGATALLQHEPLVTRNTKHFSKIPELKIVKY